jgi:hypothetical protein
MTNQVVTRKINGEQVKVTKGEVMYRIIRKGHADYMLTASKTMQFLFAEDEEALEILIEDGYPDED